MWKWLAVAALIYGLVMAGAIIAPRSMLAVGALDLAALSRTWQESGAPPQLHDFEQPTPPPFTLPESPVNVVELAEGNHILSWEPSPDVPLSFLGLPVSAGDPPPKALSVRLRAEGVQLLAVGVREEDGSVYAAVVPATPEWQSHIRPLQRLELAERTVDENNRLDVEQITAVFIAVKPLVDQRGPRKGERTFAPRSEKQTLLIELDDIGFAPPPPEGMDRPPKDHQPPGFGPPDGRRPERQPPAQSREGRQPPG